MDKRYEVFVSSTYADLKEERRSVIQALMEMDCIPAGMEIFPAADEEQFAFIKRVIDDCDYYILIIGGRYGSTTSEGISYTEKEYDYARQRKMQVLAFIHEAPGKIAFEKSEVDAHLRERLNIFRNKVKTGSIVKMWQEPKELPGLVVLSLTKTIKTHPAIGWVRANKVASSEVLSDLNELRKQNSVLQKKLASMTPALPDLAGLDEPFVLKGTFSHTSYGGTGSRNWEFEVTWGELFAAFAPRLMGEPNDILAHSSFQQTVRELYEIHMGQKPIRWSSNDQNYQTAKVQFSALRLVDVTMQGTVNGGQALFWKLTQKGVTTLLQMRTQKKISGDSGS